MRARVMVLDALQQMKLTAHTNAEKYVAPFPPHPLSLQLLPLSCVLSRLVLVSDRLCVCLCVLWW